MTEPVRAARTFLVSLVLAVVLPWAGAQPASPAPRAGDYIVAIVNQELVTAGEVQLRMAQVRAEARRSGARLPPDPELRKQVVEALIEERVLVTYARDSGVKIDEADLDRAVANIAQQPVAGDILLQDLQRVAAQARQPDQLELEQQPASYSKPTIESVSRESCML